MTNSRPRTAITPTREEDYPEWYQQVLKAADLADNSPVRGCMVIKPWGFGIWERLQRQLDHRIKASGHLNAYFPLFIPLSFLEKEAQHVEGFAKECAVVTHHRLELQDGKLVPRVTTSLSSYALPQKPLSATPFQNGLNPTATCPSSSISGPTSSVGKCAHASFSAPQSSSGKKAIPFMPPTKMP